MRKKFDIGIMILILLVIVTACSMEKEAEASLVEQEVRVGTYSAEDHMAEIIIQNDNKIRMYGPKEVSAAFMGDYTIKENKLIVTVAEQEDYIFLIEDQEQDQEAVLVLESGEWLENWVEQGTVFYFTEEEIE